MKLELNRRLMEWQNLLAAKARQIMRKLIEGRLVFEPDPEKGIYEFKGNASYGRLIAGVVQNVWCPRGGSRVRHNLLSAAALAFDGTIIAPRRCRVVG